MDFLQSFFDGFPVVKITDMIDILIVAFLIYKLLPVFKSTGTGRIAGIVGVILVVTWLTDLLSLHMLNYILSQLVSIGLLAVVIIFQPEIRRMLDHMSNIKLKRFLSIEKPVLEMHTVIEQTVIACSNMSRDHTGALIVFSREHNLEDYYKTGTVLDAQLTEQLLRNVFFPKATLHDGAVIVRNGRIAAAGCVLPLSGSDRISLDLGTRHRAALGISEVTDAVVVIVSEETGAISVAVGGVLKRHLAPQMLEQLLRNELCVDEEKVENKLVVKLRQKLQKKDKEGNENEE